MTGGYKIIDLYGLDLANMQLDSTKIKKIFSDIESTYKTKALLFDNYKINGIEQNATFSSAVLKNGGFEITLGDYKILIKNDSVKDSTLHLYARSVFYDVVLDNNERATGVCSLYTTFNGAITADTLKYLIEDGGETGYAAPGKTPTASIISIYYFEGYYVYLDTGEAKAITRFNDLQVTYLKIF